MKKTTTYKTNQTNKIVERKRRKSVSQKIETSKTHNIRLSSNLFAYASRPTFILASMQRSSICFSYVYFGCFFVCSSTNWYFCFTLYVWFCERLHYYIQHIWQIVWVFWASLIINIHPVIWQMAYIPKNKKNISRFTGWSNQMIEREKNVKFIFDQIWMGIFLYDTITNNPKNPTKPVWFVNKPHFFLNDTPCVYRRAMGKRTG